MERVRIRLYGGSWVTFSINPLEFDNQNNVELTQRFTVEGKSVEQYPFFDGRVRTMTWRNLPNKDPYKTMFEDLSALVRAGVCEMQIRTLAGEGDGNTVIQYIKILDISKLWASGIGPVNAISNLKYAEIVLRYVITTPST